FFVGVTGFAEKEYVALVEGVPDGNSGHVHQAVTGLSAHSEWTLLQAFPSKGKDSCALVKVRLHTGRKHQIRIHMAGLGHPVFGDPLYRRLSKHSHHQGSRMVPSAVEEALVKWGSKKAGSLIFLHAQALRLRHPHMKESTLDIEAPLPPHFQHALSALSLRSAA
ncbi:hypothetical protein CYMTET_18440, partial [Cymbomonas tetramitiformis]